MLQTERFCMSSANRHWGAQDRRKLGRDERCWGPWYPLPDTMKSHLCKSTYIKYLAVMQQTQNCLRNAG